MILLYNELGKLNSSQNLNKIISSQTITSININNNKNYSKDNCYLILKDVFDHANHLNKYDTPIGHYYFHTSKYINKGSFSSTYLGEDIHTGFKVIIRKTPIKYIDDIELEKYILQKVHGLGKFPPLLDFFYNESYTYLIEGLMGFDLRTLFKVCDKNLDLLSVINIGIDLLKNLKILHDNCMIHRDLKPDNLCFGPLCLQNINYNSGIGILDFGNSKLFRKKNGDINYKNGFVKCYGNKAFSSTNALLDKDTMPFDDIESMFYILIYFINGELPWKKKEIKII